MREFQATFVGIGAQKCASTWLYGVLQQCGEVKVSDIKEVDFFSYYFDRGYEWYERNLQDEVPVTHRGDISPSYFIHPDAAARAAAYNPDMQVFVTLRDPIKRAFSNHMHEVRKEHISGDNLVFETAMANNPLYKDQGRYAHHLARWYDHFPKEQIHIWFQEEIHKDREASALRVTEALKLPKLDDFLDLRANESVRYRNAAVGETLWKVGNFARQNGMGRLIETVKTAPGVKQLRDANREPVRDVVDAMQDDTEKALTEFYSDDVAALTKLISRTPPWERFTAG
ncbi:sulfotransferase domain-containing protein [Epibacterium ulvae]|uniref:sulfotransferase domain-containing protein n=1 Tax=Epibacterium ulvae TaxID=1156985 RepID=UPI001BFBFAA1|nr:sulfotransferase domain-containing protein [Epibacterium ulvae]MBT8155916.1 sulfotransferase domain-containing protein [Epibacterium ulvae]